MATRFSENPSSNWMQVQNKVDEADHGWSRAINEMNKMEQVVDFLFGT